MGIIILKENKKNLIGQRFGKLLVVAVRINEKNKQIWNCLCDCGSYREFRTTRLEKRGGENSCGCMDRGFIDLTGQKFGKLLVISRAPHTINCKKSWNCICDCQKNHIVPEYRLINGITKSCGCLRNEHENIIGNKYGRLIVTDIGKLNFKGDNYWKCVCDCGKTLEVIGSSLKNGNTQSCGCYAIDRNKELGENLIGKRFGRLLVLELIYKRTKKGKSDKYWLCQCDCGATTIAASRHLKWNHTLSCGCLQKERVSISAKLESGVASFNRLYRSYKQSARSRKISFELTKEDVRSLTSGNCVYCGELPSRILKSNYGTGNYIFNGIDRVNSNLGYTIDNSVSCCWTCNIAKLDMSVENFLMWVERVYNYSVAKKENNN